MGPVDCDKTELWLLVSDPIVVADSEDARPSRAAKGWENRSPSSCASEVMFWSNSSSETLAGSCRTVVRYASSSNTLEGDLEYRISERLLFLDTIA